jgi:hypothetical protein
MPGRKKPEYAETHQYPHSIPASDLPEAQDSQRDHTNRSPARRQKLKDTRNLSGPPQHLRVEVSDVAQRTLSETGGAGSLTVTQTPVLLGCEFPPPCFRRTWFYWLRALLQNLPILKHQGDGDDSFRHWGAGGGRARFIGIAQAAMRVGHGGRRGCGSSRTDV